MKWLIDGHNLIGQMPTLRLDDPNDEAKLLEYLRSFRARTGHTITVVFDSGGDYRLGNTQKQGGITIQFAPSGKTADQLIAQQVRKVKNPQGIMVVSSDRAVQQAATQAKVRVLSAQEFAQQLLQGSNGVADAEKPVDVQLSPEEVEVWLALFKRSNS